jgi:ATP/maltotriose-dependent transcriptional regulator MalT
MQVLDSPLILTKLRVPALRLRTVHRTHLLELLTPEPSSLILVCAPAGYGKTTLLAEWSQSLLHTGAAIAWYALDPGDDNPSLFGAYLVASLSQALGPTADLAAVARDYIGEILAVIGPPAAVNAEQADQAGLASKAGGPSQSSRLESAEALSERELEVLHLMAVGASNQVIAEQLVITVGTVKSHINHILVKLDAHNRTGAVARARELGLLEI